MAAHKALLKRAPKASETVCGVAFGIQQNPKLYEICDATMVMNYDTLPPPPPEGSIRMAVHRRRRGVPPRWTTPLQTKVTIAGNNEIYNWENLSGHFWYTNFWVPDPTSTPFFPCPPPPPAPPHHHHCPL